MTWMRGRSFPLISLLPPLVALAVFAVAVDGDFVFDDTLIEVDTELQEFNLRRIFWDSYWGPLRFDFHYRPVALLTYALNYRFGETAFGFHLVNVLLNAAVAWLVFFILRELLDRESLAALGATLYGVLSIHTEAVANIVGRAELITSLTVLGTWWLTLKNPGERQKLPIYLAGLLTFIGCCTKESGVVVVPVLLLAAWVLGKPWPWKSILAASAGIVLFLLLRHLLLYEEFRLLQEGGATLVTEIDNPLYFCDPVTRGVNGVRLLGHYLWKTVLPIDLAADYSYNQIPVLELTSGRLWLEAAAFVALVTLGAWFFWRRSRLVSLGILFFPGAFLIASNVFIPIGTIFGERLAFVPSLGYPIVLCAALKEAHSTRRLPQSLAFALLGTLIVLYGVRSFYRTLDWKDPVTLNTVTYQSSPQSSRAQLLGATAAQKQAEAENDPELKKELYKEALGRAHQAWKIFPDSGRNLGRSGLIYHSMGDAYSATSFYQKADEYYTHALETLARTRQSEPKYYFHRGRVRLELRNVEGARDDFDKAIEGFERRRAPKNAIFFNFRGLARGILGLEESAREDFDEALRLRQDLPELYNNSGFLRSKTGDFRGAIADYTQGLEICELEGTLYDPKPRSNTVESFLLRRAEAYDQLGDSSAAQRDRQRAEETEETRKAAAPP